MSHLALEPPTVAGQDSLDNATEITAAWSIYTFKLFYDEEQLPAGLVSTQWALTLGAGSHSCPLSPLSPLVTITSPYWKANPSPQSKHKNCSSNNTPHHRISVLVYKNGRSYSWYFKMVHNWIIIAFKQCHTWYPEKAGSSAANASPPFSSELKMKLVNCWKTESKLLSVGRTGDGWDKPSTPGQDRESANQIQRSRKSRESWNKWHSYVKHT